MWMDITCERNRGQTLQVRGLYRGQTNRQLQLKGSYRGQMQNGDHTAGHYITMFAEQLTRPFEVLVPLKL